MELEEAEQELKETQTLVEEKEEENELRTSVFDLVAEMEEILAEAMPEESGNAPPALASPPLDMDSGGSDLCDEAPV